MERYKAVAREELRRNQFSTDDDTVAKLLKEAREKYGELSYEAIEKTSNDWNRRWNDFHHKYPES